MNDMKNFDFTEIIARIPKATENKEIVSQSLNERNYNFIEVEKVKYRVSREDGINYNTNVRYFNTKKEVATHLSKIGYSNFYILRELQKLPSELIFITDNSRINYKIAVVNIEEEEKLNTRLWLIDSKKISMNEENLQWFEYYIDEKKMVYRRTLSTNVLKRITKTEQKKVRVGTTYDINILSIWNKYRLYEVDGEFNEIRS